MTRDLVKKVKTTVKAYNNAYHGIILCTHKKRLRITQSQNVLKKYEIKGDGNGFSRCKKNLRFINVVKYIAQKMYTIAKILLSNQ